MVERHPFKVGVEGSIPSRPSLINIADWVDLSFNKIIMEEKINLKFFFPLLLLIIILGAGLFIYERNKNIESATPAKSSGIVLGDTTSGVSDSITDGEVYSQKINQIRQPINKGFEDLASKGKYTTLFNSGEIQKIIDDTRSKIESGLETVEHLNIDSKFEEDNKKHLESLNLLLEAIKAYDQSGKTADRTEAQRLRELYAYNIDQSNKILKEIQVPR